MKEIQSKYPSYEEFTKCNYEIRTGIDSNITVVFKATYIRNLESDNTVREYKVLQIKTEHLGHTIELISIPDSKDSYEKILNSISRLRLEKEKKNMSSHKCNFNKIGMSKIADVIQALDNICPGPTKNEVNSKKGRIKIKGKRIFYDEKGVILKIKDTKEQFESKLEPGYIFDLEKGIMMALLKSEGYTYTDIEHLMIKAASKSEIGRIMNLWYGDNKKSK